MGGRSSAGCGAVSVVAMSNVGYRLIGCRPSISFSQCLRFATVFLAGCIALGFSLNANAQVAAQGVSKSDELRAFGSTTMLSKRPIFLIGAAQVFDREFADSEKIYRKTYFWGLISEPGKMGFYEQINDKSTKKPPDQ